MYGCIQFFYSGTGIIQWFLKGIQVLNLRRSIIMHACYCMLNYAYKCCNTCSYCVVMSGWSSKWPESAMRGARSEGRSTANGIAVERSRAAMRGASSGGGTATLRDVSRGGRLRCVWECVSMGLVGRRHA